MVSLQESHVPGANQGQIKFPTSQVPFSTMNQHGICYYECCWQAHLWYQFNSSRLCDPNLNCASKRLLFNSRCQPVQRSQILGSFRRKSLLIYDNYVMPIFSSWASYISSPLTYIVFHLLQLKEQTRPNESSHPGANLFYALVSSCLSNLALSQGHCISFKAELQGLCGKTGLILSGLPSYLHGLRPKILGDVSN